MSTNPLESTAKLTQRSSKMLRGTNLEKNRSEPFIPKICDSVLPYQTEREYLLGAIAQRLQESQDLDTILNETALELREFLECDRVLIYCFQPDGSGFITAESTVTPGISLLGTTIEDSYFTEKHIEHYRRGCIQVIEDIYAAGLTPCYVDLLKSIQVRANLVVPVLLKQDLWGLLIAQQCYNPRQWNQTDIGLVKQLAVQLALAVQQAQLHQQVEHLKVQLELQMEQQTAELHYCINFEAIFRRITEQIRDNLNETQALQTAAKELTRVLQADTCQIELYSTCQTMATIACEYTLLSNLHQGMTKRIADFPEIYQPLLQKQPLQSVEILSEWNPKVRFGTQLACPMFDAEGLIGNIWVKRITQEPFDKFEQQLVQQVANECAIAIRRARLHKIAQMQIQELEKLEHLKHEFLRTLSHELKTPITSINLAAQTLENVLKQEGLLELEIVPQLLNIIHKECRREGKLINDLLSLTYLNADTEPLTLIVIDMQTWIPSIVESFQELASCHKQKLKLNIARGLPLLETDITDLERILTELLNNACKFTPAGGTIAVSVSKTADMVVLSVSNSGVEIPTSELSRIFDPFYRIPNNDPWKYGGTGLGLALVQKLVKHLGASIDVESASQKTTFTLKFPHL
ncbi:hypothetical protein NUACC21_77760 [Scytonema sp. NUACC21]